MNKTGSFILVFFFLVKVSFASQDIYANKDGVLYYGKSPYFMSPHDLPFVDYECTNEVELEEGVISYSDKYLTCIVIKSEKVILRFVVENSKVSELHILDSLVPVTGLVTGNIKVGERVDNVVKLGDHEIGFTEIQGMYIILNDMPNIVFYTGCEPRMDLQNKKYDFSTINSNCKITSIMMTGDVGKSFRYFKNKGK